ncbi:MAG: hypothetical protein Q8L09_03045 [Candidatus Moranbacteria bacterium]|nr:hypothetical protein [Candidatus Moranbacteria bacterium]
MQFKIPKNTEKYEWTQHAVIKMKQYGLTAQRILRVVKNPKRLEEGIVKNTIAVMQPTSMSTKDGKRVWTREIWAMYQIKRKTKSEKGKAFGRQKIRIISAWRYPGVSPKRDPIPEEILRELENML